MIPKMTHDILTKSVMVVLFAKKTRLVRQTLLSATHNPHNTTLPPCSFSQLPIVPKGRRVLTQPPPVNAPAYRECFLEKQSLVSPDILPERTRAARVPRHRKVPYYTRTARGPHGACCLVGPCGRARSRGSAYPSTSLSRSLLCIRWQRTGWPGTHRHCDKVLRHWPTKHKGVLFWPSHLFV